MAITNNMNQLMNGMNSMSDYNRDMNHGMTGMAPVNIIQQSQNLQHQKQQYDYETFARQAGQLMQQSLDKQLMRECQAMANCLPKSEPKYSNESIESIESIDSKLLLLLDDV